MTSFLTSNVTITFFKKLEGKAKNTTKARERRRMTLYYSIRLITNKRTALVTGVTIITTKQSLMRADSLSLELPCEPIWWYVFILDVRTQRTIFPKHDQTKEALKSPVNILYSKQFLTSGLFSPTSHCQGVILCVIALFQQFQNLKIEQFEERIPNSKSLLKALKFRRKTGTTFLFYFCLTNHKWFS